MTPSAPRQIAAVILAAGRSARMGRNKMCETLAGKALVRHVAEAALQSQSAPVVVVTGHERERVDAVLDGLDVSFAFNPEFATGMAGSLKCGLAALPAESAAAVILLGDMPFVGSSLIDQLVEAFDRHPTVAAVVPDFAGVWGNPVLLGRRLFGEIAQLNGDHGARKILEAHRDAVFALTVEDDAVTIDIDTPEALRGAALRRL